MPYARRNLITWQKGLYYHIYNRGVSRARIFRESKNYLAKPVQTSSHLLHLCRYIHGNPVKDGLVEDSADWPYSNYLEWIGERARTRVDRDFINDQFDNPQVYKKFRFQYLTIRDLPDDVKRFLEDLVPQSDSHLEGDCHFWLRGRYGQ